MIEAIRAWVEGQTGRQGSRLVPILLSSNTHRREGFRHVHLVWVDGDWGDPLWVTTFAPDDVGTERLFRSCVRMKEAHGRAADLFPGEPLWVEEGPFLAIHPCPGRSLRVCLFEALAGETADVVGLAHRARAAFVHVSARLAAVEAGDAVDAARSVATICEALLAAGATGELASRLKALPESVAALGPLRERLVHGDPTLSNIYLPSSSWLVGPSEAEGAVRIIDWEFAQRTPLAFLDVLRFEYDLWATVTSWLGMEGRWPARWPWLVLNPGLGQFLASGWVRQADGATLGLLSRIFLADRGARALALHPEARSGLVLDELGRLWRALDAWGAEGRGPRPPSWTPLHLEAAREEAVLRARLLSEHRLTRNRLAMLETGLTDLREHYEGTQQERNALGLEVADLREHLEGTELERNALGVEVADLKEHLEGAERERDCLRHEVADLKEHCRAVEGERDNLRHEVTDLREHYEAVQDERDNLRHEVADLKKHHQAATGRVRELETECEDTRLAFVRAAGLADGNVRFLKEGMARRFVGLLEGREGDLNYLSSLLSHVDALHYVYRFEEIKEHHALEGAKVLVVGCGSGPEIAALEELGADLAVGLEVDLDLAKVARDRPRDPSRGAVALYGGGAFPFREAAFDVVVCSHVIEHVPSPAEMVEVCWRLVAPGGLFYLEFPNRWTYREQHTRVPLVAWLPRGVRSWLCARLGSSRSPLSDPAKRLLLGMVGDFHTLGPAEVDAMIDRLTPPPASVVYHGKGLDGRTLEGGLPFQVYRCCYYLTRALSE